jgi:hypothetical protein
MPKITDPVARLGLLRTMVAARSDGDGRPKLGYGHNVEAVKREIARLEAAGADADRQGSDDERAL